MSHLNCPFCGGPATVTFFNTLGCTECAVWVSKDRAAVWDQRAPVSAASTIDTPEFRELCNKYRNDPSLGSTARNALIDHIDAELARARKEGEEAGRKAGHDQGRINGVRDCRADALEEFEERARLADLQDKAARIDVHLNTLESNEHYRERVFNQIVDLDTKAGITRFARLASAGAGSELTDAQIDDACADVYHSDHQDDPLDYDRAIARVVLAKAADLARTTNEGKQNG